MGKEITIKTRQINRLHSELVNAGIDALSKSKIIGKLLSEYYEQHKESRDWEAWVADNCEFTIRTARRYLRVWDSREELESAGIETISDAYDFLFGNPPEKESKAANTNRTQTAQKGGKVLAEKTVKDANVMVEKASPYVQLVGRGERKESVVDAVELDATKYPIPPGILPMWNRRPEAQRWITLMIELKAILTKAKQDGDIFWEKTLWGQEGIREVENLWRLIELSKPYAVCLTCKGLKPVGCKLCNGRGYVSKFVFDTNDTDAKKARLKEVEQRTAI